MPFLKLLSLLVLIGASFCVSSSWGASGDSDYLELEYLAVDLETLIPSLAQQPYEQQKTAIAEYFNDAGHDLSEDSKNRIRFDGPLVVLDIREDLHTFLNEQLPASPQLWVGGYLYLKVIQQQDGGEEQSIRYYAKLPKMEVTGEVVQLDLEFKLEPNVSSALHRAVAPEIPISFVERVEFKTRYSVSDGVNICFENVDSKAFDVATEFTAEPQALVEFAHCSVETDRLVRSMAWQYRPQLWGLDELVAYQQHRVSRIFDVNAASSDIEDWLIRFFKNQAIDFDRSEGEELLLLLDDESLVAQLAEKEMQQLRSFFTGFQSVQARQVGTVSCIVDGLHREFEMSALTLNGKRAKIELQQSEFFDFDVKQSGRGASLILSMTPNVERLGSVSVLTDWELRNLAGYSRIQMAGELEVVTEEAQEQAKLLIAESESREEWSFLLSAQQKHQARSVESSGLYRIDFFPISRATALKMARVVDPFTDSPLHEDEVAGFIGFFNSRGVPFEGNAETSIAYDGEQLIVRHTGYYLEEIRRELLRLDFESPVVSQMTFDYTDENEAVGRVAVEMVGYRYKAVLLEFFRDFMDETGEVWSRSHLSVRSEPYVAIDYLDVSGIRADTDFRMLAPIDQTEWYHQVDAGSSGYEMQQQLPAEAKVQWKFSLREPELK